MKYVAAYHCRLCNTTFQLDKYKESTSLAASTQLEPFVHDALRFSSGHTS